MSQQLFAFFRILIALFVAGRATVYPNDLALNLKGFVFNIIIKIDCFIFEIKS